MSELRRRRWNAGLWVPIIALSVILGVPAVGLVILSVPREPRLAQLEEEPILVAPIDAVELGRATRDSSGRLGFPVNAYVYVAYEVDVTPEAAIDAWVAAYGERYDLSELDSTDELIRVGVVGNVHANLRVSDRVSQSASSAGNFKSPASGKTVVTVRVSG